MLRSSIRILYLPFCRVQALLAYAYSLLDSPNAYQPATYLYGGWWNGGKVQGAGYVVPYHVPYLTTYNIMTLLRLCLTLLCVTESLSEGPCASVDKAESHVWLHNGVPNFSIR